ncbi:unnamed protein product, partial [Discosporangium mesarthrocarpum]
GISFSQGHKPGNPKWENQDNFAVEEALGGSNVRLFVVLDGHGEVSGFSAQR